MKVAWYEKNGAAVDVMIVGELPDAQPAAGEVRVRLHTSAVNRLRLLSHDPAKPKCACDCTPRR